MNRFERIFKIYTGVVYLFLLIPPLYLVYLSFFPTPSQIILVPERFTLKWFWAVFEDPSMVDALRTSLIVSVITGVFSTVLALLTARTYIKLDERHKRWLLILVLLPVLIPGVILGLGLLSYFHIIGIESGLLTVLIAEVLWTLPFATLIVLTSMSNLSPTIRQASYDLGASRWYTFRRVELPLIKPGVLGAFLFSFLLTLNEFVRGHFVSGRSVTFPVYLYTHAYTGGLPPTTLAVSTMLVLSIFALITAYAAYLRT